MTAGSVLLAQPPGRGPMRVSPLVAALDANQDGSLSTDELSVAGAVLRKLDRNGDGNLTRDEVMPPRPDQPAGPAGGDDLVTTLFSFDENQDGKLSKSEVPERMQGIFARADANGDGLLTKDEITKATASQDQRRNAGGREGRGGPGGPGGFDPVFRALDTDQDGTVSATEISAATTALATLDRNSDGVLSADELRPMMRGRGGPGAGPGGGRDPREMIDHLFEENDSNHDGKLSKSEAPERMQELFARADADQDGFLTKDELAKAFENMGRRQ